MRPSTRTSASIAAAREQNCRAATAKTTPASADATRTPASIGPTSVPSPSIVDVAPFEAISSSGVCASDGSSAWSAGLKSVATSPTTAASAKTTTR